jgi:hypothetical protein
MPRFLLGFLGAQIAIMTIAGLGCGMMKGTIPCGDKRQYHSFDSSNEGIPIAKM